jgi:hypothetical protein
MKYLLEVKDSKVAFILELLQSFSYVKTKALTHEEAEILNDLSEAFNEVELHRQGKIKLKSANDLLNEL